MKKKLLFVILLSTPLWFFFGLRFLNYIIGSESQETLKQEIIGSLICGYGVSLGIWYNFLRKTKKKKQGLD